MYQLKITAKYHIERGIKSIRKNVLAVINLLNDNIIDHQFINGNLESEICLELRIELSIINEVVSEGTSMKILHTAKIYFQQNVYCVRWNIIILSSGLVGKHLVNGHQAQYIRLL